MQNVADWLSLALEFKGHSSISVTWGRRVAWSSLWNCHWSGRLYCTPLRFDRDVTGAVVYRPQTAAVRSASVTGTMHMSHGQALTGHLSPLTMVREESNFTVSAFHLSVTHTIYTPSHTLINTHTD